MKIRPKQQDEGIQLVPRLNNAINLFLLTHEGVYVIWWEIGK